MRSRRRFVVALVAVLLGLGCAAPEEIGEDSAAAFPQLEGPYLGQPLPGSDPLLFAPGIVNTGMFTRDMSLTPDERELYFTVAYPAGSAIMVAREVNGRWQEPRVASFSGRYRDFEPFVTPDGARLLFLSNRPPAGEEEKPGWAYQNIWAVERVGDGWGEPYPLPPPVTTDGAEFYPSETVDGTLYFTRGGEGREAAVYRSRRLDGAYTEPESLGPEVNSVESQYNAFIAPDESLLLFAAAGRDDSLGGSDCYVSFRDEQDRWTGPINLGAGINDDGDCDAASLSPDGRVLFFMSTRRDPGYGDTVEGLTLRELASRHGRPGNGSSNVYWVDASVVYDLRPDA